MSMNLNTDVALTHGGKFHADDVFSAALLRLVNPKIKIIRAFEVPEDFDGIVFDIGGGKFDHHQENAEVRENGVPYAAFGLLWREFGEQLICTGCSTKQVAREAQRFDESFVQPLDESDNTGSRNQLSGVISSFNPSWDSEVSVDDCFFDAVELAVTILKRKLEAVMSVQRAAVLVEKALSESRDGIVILPRYMPWRMVLSESDADFVVYPSQRGGYSAQIVPPDEEDEEKFYFPEEWAGKRDEELAQISGIKTLTFCHKGRFIISADTLDDIILACKKTREIGLKEIINRKTAGEAKSRE